MKRAMIGALLIAPLTTASAAGTGSLCFELDDAANDDIPQRVRDGVDLVTVSYYADDTNGGVQPPTSRLDSLFTLLRTRYPQAQLGRGECGTQYNTRIPAEITACYGYAAPVEGYVTYGGWWHESKFYAITNSTKRARHVAVTSALP